MKTLTQKPATKGQIRQITRVGTEAIEKVLEGLGLDKEGAQRIHTQSNEFSNAIRKAATASLKDLSVSDRFKDEEMESSHGYLPDYKLKGITEQTNRLRELFPGIGYADEKIAEDDLLKHAEGWFAIPRWEKIADTYGEAVRKVFNLIKQTRDGKFYNYREGQTGPKSLRQTVKTATVFQKLGDEQKDHDILVVPAQFGLRHRGRSVRRAHEVFAENEFGLGTFAIGIMILTHPKRLQHYDDLYIDCAGDEFAPHADGFFSLVPVFEFNNGKVEFSAVRVGNAYDYYGSASGFVPQS